MNESNTNQSSSVFSRENTALSYETQTASYGLDSTETTFSETGQLDSIDSSNLVLEPVQQDDTSSLVFIDSTVEDIETLTENISISGATEVIVLDSDRDELLQIGEHLSNYEDLNAVHIVSHGESGQLSFGNATLNSDTLPEYKEVLKDWSLALDGDADLLLYGCDIASDDSGDSFVRELSQLTDADISASVDDTGVDGDWELETTIGEIEATSVFTSKIDGAYQHNLDDANLEFTAGFDGDNDSTISSDGDATQDAFDDQLNNELSGGGDDDDDDDDNNGDSDISFAGDESFDASFYLEQNPDVADDGADPLKHYAETGFKEGRDPNKIFDTSFYLEQNPDVAENGGNPLEHYYINRDTDDIERYQNEVLQSLGTTQGALVASSDLSGIEFEEFKNAANESEIALGPALAIPFIVVNGNTVLAITAASLGIIATASNIQELLGSNDAEVFVTDPNADTSIPPFDLGEVTKLDNPNDLPSGDEFVQDILDGKFEFPTDNSEGVGSYFLPIDDGIPSGIDLEQTGQISSDRETHILDGDTTGGGHRAGTGLPGKTEFPSEWSDEVVLGNITKVVKDPNSTWTQQTGRPGATVTRAGEPVTWKVEGTVDGIDIRVVVEPTGRGVVTAFPTNTPQNPLP